MSINDSLKDLEKAMIRRDENRFGFLKQILLISTTLFGVLVSLHDTDTDHFYSKVSWSLSVVLLSLGILSCAVALYAQSHVSKLAFQDLTEAIREQLKEKTDSYEMRVINEPKIFGVFEKLSYLSYVLSILFLAIYAVLDTF
jgi:uncharacterized membrane protein YczE